jgi:predicted DNA-binding ribbon-helix-helix protein
LKKKAAKRQRMSKEAQIRTLREQGLDEARGRGQKQPMRPKVESRQHRELIRGSVFVSGRRTSISLEPVMWDALKEIAAEQGKIINQLVTEISRQHPVNLSASIRVYIAEYYRLALQEARRGGDGSERHGPSISPDGPA